VVLSRVDRAEGLRAAGCGEEGAKQSKAKQSKVLSGVWVDGRHWPGGRQGARDCLELVKVHHRRKWAFQVRLHHLSTHCCGMRHAMRHAVRGLAAYAAPTRRRLRQSVPNARQTQGAGASRRPRSPSSATRSCCAAPPRRSRRSPRRSHCERVHSETIMRTVQRRLLRPLQQTGACSAARISSTAQREFRSRHPSAAAAHRRAIISQLLQSIAPQCI
jgi:hypothetical protein